MDLEEYVKSVLTQLSNAVIACNEGEKLSKLRTNPTLRTHKIINGEVYAMTEDGFSNPVKLINVNFDIAVTATKDKGRGGNINISVVEFGGEKKTEHAETSRVSFSIPVVLPHPIREKKYE